MRPSYHHQLTSSTHDGKRTRHWWLAQHRLSRCYQTTRQVYLPASSSFGLCANVESASGATVTFLLRSPSVFDNDQLVQGYIKSGRARLVKGDGLVHADVKRAWDESGKDKPVDTVLFTVGKLRCTSARVLSSLYNPKPKGFSGSPSFSITKGFLIDPPNLVTQCLLNVLATMPSPSVSTGSHPAQPHQPRIVVITSMGLTPASRRSARLPLRIMSSLIAQPHRDKVGAERLIWHCAGRQWPVDVLAEPEEEVMGPNWLDREGLPGFGTYTNALIVRPALLTNGESMGDKVKGSGGKKPYRVSAEDLDGCTISRRDVAHWIVEDALRNWDRYHNTTVSITY
ncbi:hypothetical protein AX15_005299 [Amanita polypyramis BW_CC]|nr:hypothetical protein AX15_005299 [Amanita polypyramis BW_CC]